jgi:hypothetical protein
MPDLLERGHDRISFGPEGLTPSIVSTPVFGAMVTSELYFGSDPGHGSLFWPGLRPNAWLADCAGRIAELSALPPGWDGHRGRPVDRRNLLDAWALLKRLADVVVVGPAVVPTVTGGVALEWHQRGVDIEIEFISPALPSVSYEDATGYEVEGPLADHANVVAGALIQLR